MSKEPVAVVGIGQTKHVAARRDVSIAGLVREAARRALDDAELTWADIDAVVIGKAPDFFEGVMMPELYLADALGAVGKPMLRVHTAGSVGGSTALVAANLVAARVHGTVLTLAFEKQSESNAMWGLSLPVPFQQPLLAGAGGFFAPHVRAYMRRTGAPDTVGSLVAYKDRRNALKNPYAHLHEHDITLEKVQASPMLWDPIRYSETCPSSDGAVRDDPHRPRGRGPFAAARPPGCTAARCAASRRSSRARTSCRRRPARTARPTCTGRPGSPTRAGRSTPSRCTCRSPGTSRCGWRTSASPPRARAGSSPSPGSPNWTGIFRSNLSGGVLSTNPIGASGMIRFAEAALQVRGQAGEHQVDGRPPGARARLRRRIAVLLDVAGGRRAAHLLNASPSRGLSAVPGAIASLAARTTNREEHGRGREHDHAAAIPRRLGQAGELDLSNADWRSSSQGRGDVQIAFVEGFIAMRNSGSPESPSLIFTPAEWGAFVSGAREGEFDLT